MMESSSPPPIFLSLLEANLHTKIFKAQGFIDRLSPTHFQKHIAKEVIPALKFTLQQCEDTLKIIYNPSSYSYTYFLETLLKLYDLQKILSLNKKASEIFANNRLTLNDSKNKICSYYEPYKKNLRIKAELNRGLLLQLGIFFYEGKTYPDALECFKRCNQIKPSEDVTEWINNCNQKINKQKKRFCCFF
ncbi:MAG: hypothetical protein JWM09_372 [Francisellaceae bacterium]|nr:hypothetical protein [Francisellaceae bacterium]